MLETMFLIFGDKHRTEIVRGGLQLTRTCSKCGEQATFSERRVSKQFRMYFIDMFTHDTHHVLECGACGTTFVTDELRAKHGLNDHSGTLLGHLQGAVGKAEELARSEEITQTLERAKQEAGKAFGLARAKIGGLVEDLERDD